MTALLSPSEMSHRFFASRYKYVLLGIILGLILVYLVRSCSTAVLPEITYRVGQDGRWNSLNLVGKERNLSAFNNDLMAEIANRENIRIQLVITSTEELLPKLEQGKLEGILSTLRPSFASQNRLLFSKPYFLIGPVLIIPSYLSYDQWNEKIQKIVGFQSNTRSIVALEQDPSIQIKLYDDMLSALSDLSDGRIDGVVFPAIPSHIYVNTFYKDELKIISLPLNDEGIRLVAMNNETGKKLIELFNEGLAALKQNGLYDEMLNRWSLMNVEKIEN